MLMLDIHSCQEKGKLEVVYAHGLCGLWMFPDAPYVFLRDSLAEIALWLENNPSQIVTIAFEQRVADKAELQAAISQSGASRLFFYADRPNSGPNGSWNVESQGWPTLEWMRKANKRLVIFSDWHYPPKKDDGLPYVWDWCVENWYGSKSREPDCVKRPGSGEISDTTKLFIQNYSTDLSLRVPLTWFDENNDPTKIMPFVFECQKCHGRLPNFIAVDWVDDGYNGGPAAAVAEVNRLLTPGAEAGAEIEQEET